MTLLRALRVSAVRYPSLLAVFLLLQDAHAQLPGKWNIRAPLQTARTEVAAAELGGKIYLIGGYEKNGDLVEEYDPAKDSWRRRIRRCAWPGRRCPRGRTG